MVGLGALVHGVELPAQVSNMRLRVWGKTSFQGMPNIIGCVESIDSRQNMTFRECDINQTQNELILRNSNGIVRTKGWLGFKSRQKLLWAQIVIFI